MAEFGSGLQECTAKIHDLGELDGGRERERGEFDRSTYNIDPGKPAAEVSQT